MLDVCLPGTGGMMPLPDRYLTCCFLEYQGKGILIDCGEGTQMALKKAGCRYSRLELLLITHLHADHVAGLPGFLLTLANGGKQSPLVIMGPKGLKTVLEGLLIVAPPLPFEIETAELPVEQMERQPTLLLEGWDGLEVEGLPLLHRIPCLGYRITVRRKPIFNPEKAKELGIPKEFYRALHRGQAVTLEDQTVILPEQVLDGRRPSIRVCYMTDTRPVEGMEELARGADLLISEGMYGDDEMAASMEEKRHMLFSESANLAKQAGAKLLWLTHFSPAVPHPEVFEEAVRKIFPQTAVGRDGMKISL